MIDIATITTDRSTTPLAIPFDWGLMVDTARVPGFEQRWVDMGNLCAGLIERTQHFDDAYVFALEAGLHTAVIHSLFTDARAGRDDRLPLNSTERRGWLGEFFVPGATDGQNALPSYGSRLWCNYYVSGGDAVLELQRFAAQESLAWLLRDQVVDQIDVSARAVEKDGVRLLALHVLMYRHSHASPVYDAVWGATLVNAEGYYAT